MLRRQARRVARPIGACLALMVGCDEENPNRPPDSGPMDFRPLDSGLHPAVRACVGAPQPPADTFAGGLTELAAGPLTGVFPEVPRAFDGSPPATDVNGFIVDVDEDGRNEVVIAALGPPRLPTFVLRDDGPGGAWRVAPNMNLPSLEALSGVVDVDGDGHLDLVNGRPGQAIAWGVGGGSFVGPVPLVGVGGDVTMSTSLLADFDGDGWLDLVFDDSTPLRCDAPGRSLRVYERVGPRRFAYLPAAIDTHVAIADGALFEGWFGSTHALGLLGRDCFLDWNLFFAPTAMSAGPIHFDPLNFVERRRGTTEFEHPLRSAMGAALGDLDNDGVDELAITGNPVVGVWRGATLPMSEVTDQTNLDVVFGTRRHALIPWSMVFVDLDRDERLDAFIVHGTDDPSNQMRIGPEWPTAHWNTGQGLCFQEVTSSLGLRVESEWRTLHVADLDRDGDADFVVGGHGRQPMVYRNDLRGPNRGVSFELHGTTSNHLGIGAVVEVMTTADARARRFTAQSTFHYRVMQRPQVFVGLGPHEVAARVRVRWPSGYVQELRDVPAGRLHVITEPAVFDLTPSTRRMAADGVAQAQVTVTPRTPDGRFDAGAAVAVVRVAGVETAVSPAARQGDAWVATITAPRTAGETRYEVRINGQPLAIRPRMFWDAASPQP